MVYRKVNLIFWDENSNLRCENNYIWRNLEGEQYTYYQNGNVRFEFYKDRKQEGKQYYWNNIGKLLSEDNYLKGRLEGEQYR